MNITKALKVLNSHAPLDEYYKIIKRFMVSRTTRSYLSLGLINSWISSTPGFHRFSISPIIRSHRSLISSWPLSLTNLGFHQSWSLGFTNHWVSSTLEFCRSLVSPVTGFHRPLDLIDPWRVLSIRRYKTWIIFGKIQPSIGLNSCWDQVIFEIKDWLDLRVWWDSVFDEIKDPWDPRACKTQWLVRSKIDEIRESATVGGWWDQVINEILWCVRPKINYVIFIFNIC